MSTMEHAKAGFPRELLSRTKRERREYFHDYIVPHPRMKKSLRGTRVIGARLVGYLLDLLSRADRRG